MDTPTSPAVYIDADACPVKDEVYKVAARYELRVLVVANATMRVPEKPLIELIVEPGFAAADDWIADRVTARDIVVTADIPLASRCLEKDAYVVDPRGHRFTESEIGAQMAMRDLMRGLRADGTASGGPAPMSQKDRSRFLSKLDELIVAARKNT